MEISANAFTSGIGAIQSGQRRVEQAAAEIAGNAVGAPQSAQSGPSQTQVEPILGSAAEGRPDLAESLVALRVGQYEAQAGARVVETADEVLGTLIDTSA